MSSGSSVHLCSNSSLYVSCVRDVQKYTRRRRDDQAVRGKRTYVVSALNDCSSSLSLLPMELILCVLSILDTPDLMRAICCMPFHGAGLTILYRSVVVGEYNVTLFFNTMFTSPRAAELSLLVREVHYQGGAPYGPSNILRAYGAASVLCNILHRIPTLLALTLDVPMSWSLLFRKMFTEHRFIQREPYALYLPMSSRLGPPPASLPSLRWLHVQDRAMVPLCFDRPVLRLSLNFILAQPDFDTGIMAQILRVCSSLEDLEILVGSGVDIGWAVKHILGHLQLRRLVVTQPVIRPEVSPISILR